MKMIVRRTALAVCILVLALILSTAASAACTGFDDVPEFADCFRDILMDENAYAVILTRGHAHDAVALEQALATGAGYIGMIGSRRKRDAVYDALRRKGVSDAALARVHCPIGLPIGAETPGEIAVSIVGECVAHRRNAL